VGGYCKGVLRQGSGRRGGSPAPLHSTPLRNKCGSEQPFKPGTSFLRDYPPCPPPPPHPHPHTSTPSTHTIIINAHTTCPPMSERGNFRGRGGSGRGGGGEHSRGGRGGGGRGGGGQHAEKPKKENILDLTKYMDKEITVKFNGGREGP